MKSAKEQRTNPWIPIIGTAVLASTSVGVVAWQGSIDRRVRVDERIEKLEDRVYELSREVSQMRGLHHPHETER